jgi:hypothetical protein
MLEGKQVNRKKSGGVLRHLVYSLKKVIRLPVKGRNEVLKVLKRKVCKRGGVSEGNSIKLVNSKNIQSGDSSQSSVNNDLENWVVLHVN